MGGLISRRRQQQQQRRNQPVEKGDLHLAVEHDFPAWIKDLVQKGADVNKCNKDGHTPLMLAIQHRNMKCAQELINCGADVNKVNNLGDTPLMVAIQYKNLKCAQELIKCGADVNALSSIQYTALNYASQQDSGEYLEILIEAGADVNFSDYLTPLMTAAWDGKDKNVLTLIKAGANVNMPRRAARQTALSDAAREGHFECVKILIEAGADVNSTTDGCGTALGTAAWIDNIAIAKLLLKSGIKLGFRNEYGHNAIESYIRANRHSEHANNFMMLLFAAGETVPKNATHVVTEDKIGGVNTVEIPGFLQELLKPDLNLMKICRRVIREHLMKLSDVNLFVRIPKLELPDPVQSFLLYHVSLDTER